MRRAILTRLMSLPRCRLVSAKNYDTNPATPKTVPARCIATITAVFREISNASLPTISIASYIVPLPSLGPVLLLCANALLLLILCFYDIDVSNLYNSETVAYRTGFLSLAQIPLIFILAGKNNVIGYCTGLSYERLNWLHRWVARTLLLTVTIHLGFWFRDWAPYDYIGTKTRTDALTQRGLAAWAVLLWIVLSSFAPVRGWRYEIFVIQHLVSFVAFIALVLVHTPSSDHGWVWAGFVFFVFDRIVRALRTLYVNLSLRRSPGAKSSLWASEAELTPLDGGMTRVIIRKPPISWRPGQHVFLSLNSVVPLQSHPFTISSIPSDGKLEFYVKKHSGATRRMFDYARKYTGLPVTRDGHEPATTRIAIDGPYGTMRPLQQFESVVLFAGSTGATFTVPLLRDLVGLWRDSAASLSQQSGTSHRVVVTRRIRFVWVVKSQHQLMWFTRQLDQVAEDCRAMTQAGRNVSVEMSVYVTCDNKFTDGTNSQVGEKQLLVDHVRVGSFSERQKYEKQKETSTNVVTVQEIDPRAPLAPSSTSTASVAACQPDGTCCCKTTIRDDFDEAVAAEAVCNCHHPRPALFDGSSDGHNAAGKPALHPSINLLSGRPHPRTIIRNMLEQAHGETAVVACGPRALMYDVRRSVVGLSDERAVHKGTGAQGIWLWTEGFGW